MHNSRRNLAFRRQGGAALVIGMLLLLVLTLLAVSGMNTASTELIMAGNEQFQENAFQAAEVGIEQGLANVDFNTGFDSLTYATNVSAPGSSTDRYSVTVTPHPARGVPRNAMWGNRLDSFKTYHFEIASTGTSVRNAGTQHVQGMFILAPDNSGSPPPLTGEPTDLAMPAPPPSDPIPVPDPSEPVS